MDACPSSKSLALKCQNSVPNLVPRGCPLCLCGSSPLLRVISFSELFHGEFCPRLPFRSSMRITRTNMFEESAYHFFHIFETIFFGEAFGSRLRGIIPISGQRWLISEPGGIFSRSDSYSSSITLIDIYNDTMSIYTGGMM